MIQLHSFIIDPDGKSTTGQFGSGLCDARRHWCVRRAGIVVVVKRFCCNREQAPCIRLVEPNRAMQLQSLRVAFDDADIGATVPGLPVRGKHEFRILDGGAFGHCIVLQFRPVNHDGRFAFIVVKACPEIVERVIDALIRLCHRLGLLFDTAVDPPVQAHQQRQQAACQPPFAQPLHSNEARQASSRPWPASSNSAASRTAPRPARARVA